MLTPYLPYPPVSGGQVRSYNLIKNLALKHEITLFSLIKTNDERKYISELEKYCKKVKVFKRSEKPWTPKNILRTGLSLFPFLVIRNWSREEKEAVKKELENEKYDLIHAETFYAMPMIPKTSVPILLVEQTIEYLVYQHFMETTKWVFIKPLLAIDIFKLKRWEKYYWEKANRVGVMSEEDKEIVKKLSQKPNVDIIPNGVDVNHFAQKAKRPTENPTILYVGNFNWLQNREAAEVLVREVWPKIKSKVPNAKLWIVGRNPTDDIKAHAGKDVRVDGTVEDIRDAYANSDVLVAPILGGGGTRYKILEAMASGLPVVTTSIGIGGIEAENGINCIIEDDKEKTAQVVADILSDEERKIKIAESAKKLVDTKYNWISIADKLDTIYREVGGK